MAKAPKDILTTQYNTWWRAIQSSILSGETRTVFQVNPKGQAQIVTTVDETTKVLKLKGRIACQMARWQFRPGRT